MKTRSARGSGNHDRVRFAVVGQGHFAQSAVLPAFANAKRCQLTALFSDDFTKLKSLKKQYEVEYALPYDQYDDFLESGEVDAVYIALPNDLHAAFVEGAAQRGVHVLCEKPIAATSSQAERMISACERGGVKLMIAYRLHFEAANLRAVEIARRRQIGEARFFSATFSLQVARGNTRTQRVHAAGPLRDVGIYCVNAARAVFRDEPAEAVAFAGTRRGDDRFREIDEQVSAILRFPGDRLAQLTCSFGAYNQSSYTVVGTKGRLRLDPAFTGHADIGMELEVDGKVRRKTFPERDQVAPELEELAACILEDRDPQPSGREGLADLLVIEAIEESVRTGGRVDVRRLAPERRPSIAHERKAPPHPEPRLVHARPPKQG